VGCTAASSVGIYDGFDSSGWVHYENEGAHIYRMHTYRQQRNDPEIVFFSNVRSLLYLTIRTESKSPLKFSGEARVEIRSVDGTLIQAQDLNRDHNSGPPNPRELITTLHVPAEKEFEVIVPEIQSGDIKVPRLVVHFRWSDRRVWSTQHIFGS